MQDAREQEEIRKVDLLAPKAEETGARPGNAVCCPSEVIDELRKEIPGIVPVSPHGGKLSRAQAMAPLWEAGSVHLPDPQVFKLPWMESYIHNICTFPRAAHDDDMDATSQALIYMRAHNADGIIEFYRRKAAEAAQGAASSHA